MDWLEWSGRLNRNRHALERIVALLFALAVLAERAAGLTGSRRQSARGILGYAHAEARGHVIGLSPESGAPVEPAAEVALAHGQAERLAASFRALALMLGTMLALARRFGRNTPTPNPSPQGGGGLRRVCAERNRQRFRALWRAPALPPPWGEGLRVGVPP